MPTGYTQPIADGISFEEYALGCARAFGALIEMREEPADAPIPEEFKPSDFYARSLAAAQETLALVMALTPDEAEQEAQASYEAHLGEIERRTEDAAALRQKYEAMLAAVNAWPVPSPHHERFKHFMAEQIEQSIAWDCEFPAVDAPVRMTGPEWLAERIDDLRQTITRHHNQNLEEIQRTADRNRWVRTLRESLRRSA